MPSLRYGIEVNTDETARIEWLGACEHTAASLLSQPADDDGRTALGEAEEWLRDALQAEPQRAEAVKRAADKVGISAKTLRRARERLCVKVTREGFGLGGYSVWSLLAGEDESLDHTCPPESILAHQNSWASMDTDGQVWDAAPADSTEPTQPEREVGEWTA